MKDGPGLMFGIGPGAPVNDSGCIADYLPPAQRIVVTPNNDTFYGVAFVDLGRRAGGRPDADDVPEGHYWVMQIADVFTNVDRTLGSAWEHAGRQVPARRPGLAGREAGRLHRHHPAFDQLRRRLPAQLRGAYARRQGARAIAVQNQMGVYPLSQNQAGRKQVRLRGLSQEQRLPPAA